MTFPSRSLGTSSSGGQSTFSGSHAPAWEPDINRSGGRICGTGSREQYNKQEELTIKENQSLKEELIEMWDTQNFHPIQPLEGRRMRYCT